MADKIAVLVVDDSPFIRQAVRRMLEPLEEVEVVGTATNGQEALDATLVLEPDLIVLDIVMPEMDGLTAIREIMSARPTPILVLSSHTQPGAETTLTALELGAVDFVSKSDAETLMDIYDLAPVLQEKVLAVAGSRPRGELEAAVAAIPVAAPGAPIERAAYDVLVLGASTGGPRALAAILSRLPATFPAGIVVAQHMPPGFTSTLADRLDRRSELRVREAADGDRVEPGVVLIGMGGRQIRVVREDEELVVRVPMDSDRHLHRPSVDLLMSSAAAAVGARAVGAVLTGMGQDGADGLAAIREAGGRTFAESEETAVIFGMPQAAAAAAEHVLPLDRLARCLQELFIPEEAT